MIISLILLADTTTNPDLRRRFAVNTAEISIDVRVKVDVAVTIRWYVIVSLKNKVIA